MKKAFTYFLLISVAVACHVDIPQKPLSLFRFTPENGCKAPCTVTFTSQSENAASLLWDFGDETELVSGDSVTHEFLSEKIYQVKLIVRGIDGGSSGNTQAVKVDRADPKETFGISGDNNFPTDIVSDANGNIYISGTGKGTIQFGTGKVYHSVGGSDDFFVAKFNSSGQCQWVYMDGSTGDDHANALALGNNNDVYVTGFISGSVNKSDVVPKGKIDGFVARLNGLTGAPQWFKTFGGPLEDQGRSLAFDERGEGPKIYMVGVVEGDNKNKNIDLNGVSVPANERDGFLAVLDARNGEFQRRSMITGPNAQVPETITVDNEGNAYVAGAFLESVSFSSPDQTLSGVDSVDIFVAKWGLIDTGFLWARRAASARVDFAYDIEVDNDKNVYVTGMHNGDITELSLHSRGDENAYLAKWNAQGKVVAASNGFHNGNRDYHGGIARTKEGNIVLAGSFSSTTAQFPMVGGKSVQGKGVTDIILTEVEPNQLTPTGFLVSDGGAYEDRVNKICITNTGYVYAAGWFKTNSNFNEININGKSDERNTFITRYKLH